MSQRPTDVAWRSGFGDDYNRRNEGLVERNVAFLAKALSKIGGPINDVIEFGCGTGQNLVALSRLFGPLLPLGGIEINNEAATIAKTLGYQVWEDSAIDVDLGGAKADLVLTKGFLIHVAPVDLPAVYSKIVQTSRRFILIAEYYNPTPISVEYRGELGLLWKRDFATELLGLYPSLRVVDYGFTWRHDYPWYQDDITHFLIEKR